MHLSRKKDSYINTKLLKVIIISLLIFSQELRSSLGNLFLTVNILAVVALVMLIVKNVYIIRKNRLIILYITLMIYVLTALFYEKSILDIICVIMLFILPLSLTILEINNNTFEDIFKYMIKIFNIVVIVITVTGILEMIFKIDINLKIMNFMTDRLQYQIMNNSALIKGKRLYSFMGHPLFNTQLYLMFLILNILYNKYLKNKTCPLIILAISSLGISFTGSKTGFILLTITILMLCEFNSKVKKSMVIIIGLFFCVKFEIFNTVIERFFEGSLTTGRYEKWIEIKSMHMYPIKFFSGYGRGFTYIFNTQLDWALAAFEYPIRMFSLEYGVVVSIMIYIFIMLFPIASLIKNKHWHILSCYGVIFVDVNTYNGLSTSGDKMMLFCLFIFIILNLSNYICKVE